MNDTEVATILSALTELGKANNRANFLAERVAAVRELHTDGGCSQGYIGGGRYVEYDRACTSCGEFGEYGVEWPCPTIQALDGDQG